MSDTVFGIISQFLMAVMSGVLAGPGGMTKGPLSDKYSIKE